MLLSEMFVKERHCMRAAEGVNVCAQLAQGVLHGLLYMLAVQGSHESAL
jgi:hypothetical protein